MGKIIMGGGTYTYSHEDVNGCTQVDTLHLTINMSSRRSITEEACYEYVLNDISYKESGVYEQILEAESGCDSVITLYLTIYPNFEVTYNETICEGQEYNGYGFEVYSSQTVNVNHLSMTRQLQTINGCDSIINLELDIIDTNLKIISLTGDFCEGNFAELSVLSEMTNFEWSNGETSQNIVVTTPGTYVVTASQYTCSVSATYIIEKCPFVLYLPNTISPGTNDGLNDYFCIPEYNQRMIGEFEIYIYSRWGELVYQSKDKNFKWNGEYNGHINQNVMYNYMIKCTDLEGLEHMFVGNITIL